MRAYFAFTKKEFLESFRTYKLPILVGVFILLGIMNPLTAKLTPQLLESFMPEGMLVAIPEPTAIDSWAQFFKNVNQMGLIVTVIMFSGLMATEFSKGTLIIVLTKGLKRSSVILSKFTVASVLWTLSLSICFVVSYAYTVYFWNGDGLLEVLFAVLCLWLFGIILISVLLVGGVILKNSYGSLLFVVGTMVVMFMLNLIPDVKKHNPLLLISGNMDLITGKLSASDFTVPMIIGVALLITFIIAAVQIFNKKHV